ncbi:MAG: thiamine-binding protein [Dehalococcoidia bacterium]|nr:thiamine-binding protein [Dehalococcoidia bacterium]
MTGGIPKGDAMIAEIQVLPRPAGTDTTPYANVEAAIAVIQQSGLQYEVGALGTTIEGDAEAVWPVLQQAHAACLAAGAESVATVIKVHETRATEHPGMAGLVAKFRE